MFINKSSGLRVNINARYNDPITGVQGIDLTDADNRERFGIMEIADPTPPADYSEETYFRTEQDSAPYVVFTKKPDEMIEKARQSKVNQEALDYLKSTDWYVARFSETGKEIPEEIKQKRQEARDSIVEIAP